MTTEKDFFQVLGHISVFFSTLDVLTSIFIRQQIKSDFHLKFNDKTTLGQKYKILQGFNQEHFVSLEVYSDFVNILPEAIEISEKRNRFIHDQWIFNQKNIEVGTIERGMLKVFETGKWKMDIDVHTLDELYVFLNELGELQKKVGIFIKM